MISLPLSKLKEILIKGDVATEETINGLYEEAERRKQNVIDLIVSEGLVREERFYDLLAESLSVQRVNLGAIKIDENVLRLISQDVAERRRVILFKKESDGSLDAAMEDPTDLVTIDFLKLRLKTEIHPYLATDDDLNRGFVLYQKQLTFDFKKVIEDSIKASLSSKTKENLKEAALDVPIVAIVDNLLGYGVSSRASDIHFEVLDDAVLVRYRIDGILHEIIRMPKEVHQAVVARIKLLSTLRVDEHTHPQDGRFRHKINDQIVDIRVSIIPTYYGEKVEMRLLSASQKPLSFSELGMFDDTIKSLEEAFTKSYGMVLICGPTGAGKTTTLYSILNTLNRPGVNIVTIEDPIEYDIRYVNQMQVNATTGITFSSGLRAILRQDPNIIMVGEIRDDETANIAIQSALTGHLVLSSLHTNDASSAIPRLVDMGVLPFLASSVLNAVSSQRLARKTHMNCVESYAPPVELMVNVQKQAQEMNIDPQKMKIPKILYKGRGCPACNGTGYLGRVGVFEVLKITEAIRALIMSPSFSLDNLKKKAREEGMLTMFEDGMKKVELGMTTIDEVFRVIRE